VSTIAARGQLLEGPTAWAPESLAEHRRRLGSTPAGDRVLEAIEAAQLRGRGGAEFPAGAKWRAVAARRGSPVVLVNGAEADPMSLKDRTLLVMRPHLVWDGALAAAEVLGAAEVVVYIGRDHTDGRQAMEAALAERRSSGGLGRRVSIRFVEAPARYVAGEETAAVRVASGGPALPTFRPPRPFERGVRGRPTLVHNVETLAAAALAGRGAGATTRLFTLGGAIGRPGVTEAPVAASLGELLECASADRSSAAVLVGGCFGTWVPLPEGRELGLDRLGAGCGSIHVLERGQCGLAVTASIVSFLAEHSAGQCGPCRVGLPAVAQVLHRLALGGAKSGDGERLSRWASQLSGGRGACAHPDGAARLLASALRVFADDLRRHLHRGPCPGVRGG
jgi:NADH:ubiquinone oxidoreductase subunit F (NADH-binding)